MKVRTLKEAKIGRPSDGSFISYRLLTESDNMGFTVCKTVIPKGGPHHWHYTKHQEACYCISGHGLLLNKETSEEFHITPDTIYILDNHDDHEFTAFTDVILISVFNPPLTGHELHKEDGSYE